jgi:hypothetical protein
MLILSIISVALLIGDIGSTWYLLSKYGNLVLEGNPLVRWMFGHGWVGEVGWGIVRVIFLTLVIHFKSLPGLLVFVIPTVIIVVMNISKIIKLRR